jgi:hypothetical protein
MAYRTPQQIKKQWRLAGRLCVILTLIQLIVFAIHVVNSSLVAATIIYWMLILGFCITGVVAVVCLTRANGSAPKRRA